jgi:hypothetical protein
MSKDYVPLYPLLAKFWDKPFARMPKKLQVRVKRLFWNTTWDKADIEMRQDAIRSHDILCDDTQEINTWHQLFLYAKNKPEDGLDDAILHCLIEDAKNNGKATVAYILKDHVANPLAELLDDKTSPFPHWPNTEPLLWRKLYRFSRTLPAMRDAAKMDKDYDVVLALDDVSAQLERILDIDRDRVSDTVVAAYEEENAQQAAPTDAQNTNSKVSDGERRENFDALASEYAPMLRERPKLTATQLMVQLLGNVGKSDTCILNRDGVGLCWESFNGGLENLTLKQLEDRIYRWRKKNKTRS